MTAPAPKANPFHLSKTAEHGTPPDLVELARYALGGIDLDPASSDYWNRHLVKATRFYDQRTDGLKQPWFGRVFINPPGDPKGYYVGAYWDRLCRTYAAGEIDAAVWVGFSLEQLVRLQGRALHPLQFITLIPCERPSYMQRPEVDGRSSSAPPVPQPQPTHGSFVTLLHDRRSPTLGGDMVRRFTGRARELTGDAAGALVRPL